MSDAQGRLVNETHAREIHAYEVPVHEIHAREVHTYEMHAHKVQAREMHTREMYTHEMYVHRRMAFMGGYSGAGVIKQCPRTAVFRLASDDDVDSLHQTQ